MPFFVDQWKVDQDHTFQPIDLGSFLTNMISVVPFEQSCCPPTLLFLYNHIFSYIRIHIPIIHKIINQAGQQAEDRPRAQYHHSTAEVE